MPLHDLASLFRRHRDGLLRFLKRRGAAPAAAEDLVQETFVRFLQAKPGLEVNDPRAYLFRTAANLAIDEARSAASRPTADLPEEGWAALADPAPSQERVVVAREELVRLARAIRGLSPRCRAVLMLVRFEGLTYREAGERLGISTKTAHGYMVEALLRLHRQFEGRAPGK